MAHDAREVANFFIRRALKQDVDLTHLKLQKLVFIAHGWNLAINKESLIHNRIEAWPHGPVIPDLFHELKHLGRDQIDAPIRRYDPLEDDYVAYKATFDDNEKEVLEEVWRVYGNKSALFLSELTHRPGTPWTRVRQGDIISRSVIQDYYSSKIGS